MELYHKKNIESKPYRRGRDRDRDRNPRNENNQRKNVYLHKMIQQNLSQSRNEPIDLTSAGDSIPNIRSNMEEIFATDETKKKAIKYVLEIGRNRNIRNSSRSNQRLDKSASPPMKMRGGYIRGNIESFRTSPNNNFYNGRAYNISITSNKYPQGNDYNIGPKTVSNFYNPNQLKTNNYIKINDNQDRNQNYDGENEEYYESQPNYANINQQDRNDYDLISVNNIDEKAIQGMKYARSPEPRMANRIIQSLNDSYERASRRSNLPQRRNKDIQMMPRQRKQYNTSYFSTNTNNDDDVSELIRSIEELQSVINGQKNEIKNIEKI
jgi:hypothetical protein